MLPAPFTHALVLTGPTGSGKSALAVELAIRLDAEIISMDSMALYRGMDIGTAKPTAEERARVPHHLIDVLDPWESASVAWWLEQARRCCLEIEARGKQVLVVGGTPLYLKALLCGLFEGPGSDPVIRARLEAEAADKGGGVLHERLERVDPVTAARLHPHDVRRLVRALEVWELTGRPISAWQQEWPTSPPAACAKRDGGKGMSPPLQPSSRGKGREGEPPRCLYLDRPRDELYRRINERVEGMFAAGLLEEVRRLRELPRPISRQAAQALGYKEVFRYLDGQATLEATIREVQTRSRNFAKRQLTWFRHLPGCIPASEELTLALWNIRIK